MSGPEIYSDTFPAFGGNCYLVFTGLQVADAKNILQKVKNGVEQLENIFSTGSLMSDARNLNYSEAKKWVEVDPVLLNVLSLCYDFYSISNGAFDVSDRPLYDLWDNTPQPDSDQIEKVRNSCGFDRLEIDAELKRVRFLKEGMKLDFRVIEKAYTAEVLKSLLIENGAKDSIISFDEEVILALGKHPSGDAWPVGIRNLQNPAEFLHVFESSGRCIVTAGTVFYEPDTASAKSRRIISPESGLPVSGKRTVSVCGTSATLCAFIAHIWLILPEHDQSVVAEQLSDLEIFEVEYLENDIKTKLTILNNEQNTEL